MLAFIKIELRRFWHHSASLAGCILKTIALSVLTVQILGDLNADMIWVFLPLISWMSLVCYSGYLGTEGALLLLDSGSDCRWMIRVYLGIISVGVNMVLAGVLSAFFVQGLDVFVAYWFVLDIVSLVMFCIGLITSAATGSVMGQLMLFPVAFPWVIFGVMASDGHLPALKIIVAAWLFMQALGVYLYFFCVKLAE